MTDTSAAMEMPPPSPQRTSSVKGLPRRRFFSDMPDRGLFVGAALLGFLLICVLKVQGYDANYVAAFAVGLMLIYGTSAFNIPLVQMRLDRLGDNFYYLGFIFTLASLSAALLQLRNGVRIEELLGSFGIALVTTIVGIAGRVLFVQLRSEIDDIEEHVRHDLATASADLRAQLSSGIRDFETFRIGLFQALNETSEAFSKSATELEERVAANAQAATQGVVTASGELQKELAAVLREFEAFRAKFAKASNKHTEQIEALANSSVQKMDSVFDNSQRHSQHATETVQSIGQAVESAMKRLAEMELPSEQLNREFRDFIHELEGLTARLGAGAVTKPRGFRKIWSVFRRKSS
jgi:hypothetical protein